MERITILALHGFLGHGHDWSHVQAYAKDFNWICPDLFSECQVNTSSFDSAVDGIVQIIKNIYYVLKLITLFRNFLW